MSEEKSRPEMLVHFDALKALGEVFKETATPEQRQAYWQRLDKLIDENLEHRDLLWTYREMFVTKS